MYEYRATLVKVVDGDTIDIDVDLGFRLTVRQRCRLKGLNCPEKKGVTKAAGDAATAFSAAFLGSLGSNLVIRSAKPYADDKYGRFLVDVFVDGKSLNEALLLNKHAVPFMAD